LNLFSVSIQNNDCGNSNFAYIYVKNLKKIIFSAGRRALIMATAGKSNSGLCGGLTKGQ
jgi:hypothetical protein